MSHRKVLVAGGGPVGKVVGCMLAKSGVRTVLVDHKKGGRHPKAHAVTCRSMEILKMLDEDVAERVMKECPADREWGSFRYVDAMCGEEYAVQDHMKGAAYKTLLRESTSRPVHVSQPLVEDALDELVDRSVAKHGLEVVEAHADGITQTPDKVSLKLSNSEEKLEGDFAVVADGANSALRQGLGVGMTGPGSLQHFMSVHFFSKELGEALSASRPGMLYFVFNPTVIACVVAHNLARGEFVAQIPFYPPHQSPADFTPTHCLSLLNHAISLKGDLPNDIKVNAAHPWLMAAQIAEKFQIGRCFLAGDAAHRFPPAGGLGLNTGLQDAQNIAWKLAAVCNGTATTSLLDSYDIERRSAGKRLLNVALDCFEKGMKVPQMMGMNHDSVRMLESVCSGLPWGSAAFTKGLDLGMNLTRLGGYRKDSIQSLADSWGTIPLFFSADDLGVSYANLNSSAVIGDATAPVESLVVDGVPQYTPSLTPGARMPYIAYNEGSRFEPRGEWVLVTRKKLSKTKMSVVYVESSSEWDGLSATTKAVLVRPDGYIAWASDAPTAKAVQAAFERLLS